MTKILLKGADHIITMDGADLEGADILIGDGTIEAVGQGLRADGATVINLAGALVTPGLVNTHHHLFQALTRAVPGGQDALLFGWLKTLYPIWSRFGPEEWLKPYTVEEVARLAQSGKSNIAVIAPAFSADCIETLEEIEEEIRESFEEAGGDTFTYIPCLNDDDAHIAALAEAVEESLAGWIK